MRLAVLTTHPVQYYAPLFRELAERIDVQVFYAHRATASQQAAAGFGTAFDWNVDLLSGYEHVFLKNTASQPNASRFLGGDTPEVGAYLKRGSFDAVLSLGWHVKSLLQGILAAKRQGTPVMVRGDSQLGMQASRLKLAVKSITYPALLRVFDAALVVGTRNREFFAHYRYPESRMFSSPHAVDTQRFAAGATAQARAQLRQRLGVKDDERIVLFAGKLLPFKRPLQVVKAVAQLSIPNVSVLVAGSGPLNEEMVALAARLGVRTTILGFVNQSEMPAVYAASDVLMLPSDGRETWGLVANEAIASGRGIVVSDQVGCAPDLARDGVVGHAFTGGSVAMAAAALETALSAPPSQEATSRMSSFYSLQAAAEGIVEAGRFICRKRWHHTQV